MATVSSAPTVRAALVALLATALPTVTVTYSNPGAKRVADNIYLGDITENMGTYPVARQGRMKREESYITEVVVDCFRGGDDAQTAETAAFALLGGVEDTIANDIAIGLKVTEPTLRCKVEHWKLKISFDMAREGWAAKITIEVRVEIRLQ